jgi:hypothetical protein
MKVSMMDNDHNEDNEIKTMMMKNNAHISTHREEFHGRNTGLPESQGEVMMRQQQSQAR